MTETNDAEILIQIGRKLKEIRLTLNMKQKELADLSGISLFSVSQIETGHNTSMQSLIQILRTLNRLDLLDAFMEETQDDRQRVRRGTAVSSHPDFRYTLPENNDYSMAAEVSPFKNNRI